jgi:hypothetical protein
MLVGAEASCVVAVDLAPRGLIEEDRVSTPVGRRARADPA